MQTIVFVRYDGFRVCCRQIACAQTIVFGKYECLSLQSFYNHSLLKNCIWQLRGFYSKAAVCLLEQNHRKWQIQLFRTQFRADFLGVKPSYKNYKVTMVFEII